MPQEFLKIGSVIKPHGIKGEVKVFSTTSENTRYKKLSNVFLKSPNINSEMVENKIEGVKFFKEQIILKLEQCDSVEQAEKLRNTEIYVKRKDGIKLEKDEYYIADLLQMKIRNENGEEIGILTDVLETGANDVYIIDLYDKRELLLPAINECIIEVNIEENYMVIHILEGLL